MKEKKMVKYCRNLVLLAIVAIFLVACGGASLEGAYTVSIERSVSRYMDPILFIRAEKAVLHYEQRFIEIIAVKNIGGNRLHNGGWPVKNIEINQKGDMLIEIPPDADYNIWIGNQYHYLPKIAGSEIERKE